MNALMGEVLETGVNSARRVTSAGHTVKEALVGHVTWRHGCVTSSVVIHALLLQADALPDSREVAVNTRAVSSKATVGQTPGPCLAAHRVGVRRLRPRLVRIP